MMNKPALADRYIHLGSEDIWTSMLFGELRKLPPEFLRRIINQAVGHEVILADELDADLCQIKCWEKLDPPLERNPRGRNADDGTVSFFQFGPSAPKEGQTEADVIIQLGSRHSQNRYHTLVLVEMKWRSPPATKTSNDSNRHQMVRNLQAILRLSEKLGSRRMICILWDNKYGPDPMIRRMRNPTTLRTLVKERHLSNFSFEEVAENVGWVNYSQVRNIVAELVPQMPTRIERMVAKDLLFLLDDLLARSVRQTELPL
ncbi:hypothetical protein WDW37_09260 [Bdellovibrionota bacterium FG-1]